MMQDIRAVIFDVGNCIWFPAHPAPLAEVFALQAERLRPLFASWGMAPPKTIEALLAEVWAAMEEAYAAGAENETYREPSLPYLWRGAMASCGVEVTREQADAIWHTEWIPVRHFGDELYPDTRDVLRGLKERGFLVGLCTNRPCTNDMLWPDLHDFEIADYIDSGRYEADVARVVDGAIVWLEERADQVTRPAIVLDIDETSLSNWPAYRVNGWGRVLNGECNLEQGPCGLRAWQAMAQSKALKPTLDLDHRAKALGVAVFFITGRPSALQEMTEKNLREQGFEWDGVILQPPGSSYASAADFKAPERKKIADQGYTIILSMGDQQSDLTGGYAERTFKLPNPVYFIP
jgi:acid phosphatase